MQFESLGLYLQGDHTLLRKQAQSCAGQHAGGSIIRAKAGGENNPGPGDRRQAIRKEVDLP